MIRKITVKEANELLKKNQGKDKQVVLRLGNELYDVSEAGEEEIAEFIRKWQMERIKIQ